MKKLKSYMILFLSLTILYSCSDSFEEHVEIADSAKLSDGEFTVTSLENINNPQLTNQLNKSVKQIKGLISKEFDHLLIEHNLAGLAFNTDHILIVNNDDQTTSYSLYVTVPQENGEEALNLNGYLTLSFDSEANVGNTLQIGYQMEHYIGFDQDGNIVEAIQPPSTEGYYTPKPSNLASKAPKYIVCQYTYCGYGGWSGSYGPAPQWVLDQFPWLQTEGDIDDLTILNKQWYETTFTAVPFSQFNGPIKNDFSIFYDRERMDFSYGGQKTYWNNFGPKVLGHHIHKKAFIDSFQRWLFKSLDPANSQTTYTYLVQNPTVMSQVFNVFADRNLLADTEDGAYFEVPYGGYSQDPNVRCINQASQYLLTAAGLTLLQQLGSGAITLAQFEAALPGCN